MKNSLIILIWITLVLPGCKKDTSPGLPGQWTQKTSLPFLPGRTGAAGFSIGDKGYFIGGSDNPVYYGDVYEFDPAANSWTKKTSCPGDPLFYPVYFVINSRVYIGLGQIYGGESKQFWEYNPATDTWTRKSDFLDSGTHTLPFFTIGQFGYLLSSFHKLWKYDPPSDQWTQLSTPPATALSPYAANFVIGNKAYSGAGSNSPAFWEYDSQQDSWTAKKDCPGGGIGCSGTALNGMGYFFQGSAYSYRYDPIKNEWTQTSFLAEKNSGAAFTLGLKIYYAAGANPQGELSNKFWEYTP